MGEPINKTLSLFSYMTNKLPEKLLLDSKVKTAILCLTSEQIPKDENFEFVIDAIDAFGANECRAFLFENYYDELLEWADFNTL